MSAAIELVDPLFTNIVAETNRWQSNSSDRYHSISDIDWCTSDCKRILHWSGDVDYMYKKFYWEAKKYSRIFCKSVVDCSFCVVTSDLE